MKTETKNQFAKIFNINLSDVKFNEIFDTLEISPLIVITNRTEIDYFLTKVENPINKVFLETIPNNFDEIVQSNKDVVTIYLLDSNNFNLTLLNDINYPTIVVNYLDDIQIPKNDKITFNLTTNVKGYYENGQDLFETLDKLWYDSSKGIPFKPFNKLISNLDFNEMVTIKNDEDFYTNVVRKFM